MHNIARTYNIDRLLRKQIAAMVNELSLNDLDDKLIDHWKTSVLSKQPAFFKKMLWSCFFLLYFLVFFHNYSEGLRDSSSSGLLCLPRATSRNAHLFPRRPFFSGGLCYLAGECEIRPNSSFCLLLAGPILPVQVHLRFSGLWFFARSFLGVIKATWRLERRNLKLTLNWKCLPPFPPTSVPKELEDIFFKEEEV